jgi:hydrogenase maturation protease
MNRALVDRVVAAVLYEGYILYPYRPSVKNQQRWTFGGLYPEAYCRAQSGADAPSSQTECLIHGSKETKLDVAVRFLHLTERNVGEFVPPLEEWSDEVEPPFRRVENLRIDDQLFQTWQEAEERNIELTGVQLSEILTRPRRQAFSVPAKRWLEPLQRQDKKIGGVLVREQQAIQASVTLAATEVAPGLFRLTLRVTNDTPLEETRNASRDAALSRTLVSTHAILVAGHGEFVSLLDPPEPWRQAAASCRNIGTYPVLVGEEGAKDTVLSSPIILYDYPSVAPESAGDLFDATEIDEILTLRVLTLTDEEKRAAAALDSRARDLLARAESMNAEQLGRLHGTLRNLRPLLGDKA